MAQITIDLGAVGTGRSVSDGNIRTDAFKRVLAKLVEKPASTLEDNNPRNRRPLSLDVMPNRRHDAVMVSARRGDGKTTFLTGLLTLIERVQAGEDTFAAHLADDYPAERACALYSLGIIDPTLIETKQNIVVIVIEKIKAAVDRAFEVSYPDARGKYEDFRERLRDLASGLNLLDGIGDDALYGKDWADPDYVLDKGLDRARSAGAFERSFHRYVHDACAFLRTDAFVLGIDDVDTSFEKGWPVLEALRKYFATPQLKVILAGDLKLYNLLVRQQQWKHITKEFADIEAELRAYADQLGTMVDALQEQYLVKIVRPENRVDLRSLLHYADRNELAFKRSGAGASEMTERDFFRRYAAALLAIGNAEDRAPIRSTILRLPVRSSLQAIAGAWDLVHSAGDSRGRVGPWRQIALDTLHHIAATRLMSLDLDESALRDPDPDRIFGILSRWMTEKSLWPSMARLHPEGVDESRDLASVFLAATLVELFRLRPRTMIDYWLRICTLREKVDRGDFEKDTQLRELLEHVNAYSSERSLQFVSRLAAWEVDAGRQITRGIRLSGSIVPAGMRVGDFGAIAYELYGISGDWFDRERFRAIAENGSEREQTELQEALPPPIRGYHKALMASKWPYSSRRGTEAGVVTNLANSLETLRRGLSGDVAAIALIPASRITSGQGYDNGSYSVLRLIAFVGEVLDLARKVDASERRTAVQELLARHSYLRSYPAPSISEPTALDDERDEATGEKADDESADEEYPGPEAGDIVSLLLAWVARVSEIPPMNPITLARIWTRFSYTFDNVRGALRHLRTRYLGVLIHRTIVAFLHAVGVECLRAAGYPLSVQLAANPVESGVAFAAYLDHITDPGKVDPATPEIRFFEALFCCPLWGYFLARHDQDITGSNAQNLPTERIWKHYVERMGRTAGSTPQYTVKFRRSGGEPTASFEGLYFLLNTIQLQGQGAASRVGRVANDDLSKLLSRSPSPKLRRAVHRVPARSSPRAKGTKG